MPICRGRWPSWRRSIPVLSWKKILVNLHHSASLLMIVSAPLHSSWEQPSSDFRSISDRVSVRYAVWIHTDALPPPAPLNPGEHTFDERCFGILYFSALGNACARQAEGESTPLLPLAGALPWDLHISGSDHPHYYSSPPFPPPSHLGPPSSRLIPVFGIKVAHMETAGSPLPSPADKNSRAGPCWKLHLWRSPTWHSLPQWLDQLLNRWDQL